MMDYLTPRQVEQLLRPINPSRVGKDGKGFSHVEAYEIRAHLNRVFGFARWSEELTDLRLVYETEDKAEKGSRWTVCYAATIKLAIHSNDGFLLATYTEAATGEAKNQPQRGDAHDLAIKTAESQAFKRCAVNLGDNFGLSLYARGSLAPLVKATLVTAKSDAPTPDAPPVDAHLTEQLPPESEQAPDNRETSTKPKAEKPAKTDRSGEVTKFRDRALSGEVTTHKAWAEFQMEVMKAGLQKAKTTDADGNEMTLLALVQQRMKQSAA